MSLPNDTDSNDTQPLKALLETTFKLLPMDARVRALQLQYLQPAITQYFASNKSEIWS